MVKRIVELPRAVPRERHKNEKPGGRYGPGLCFDAIDCDQARVETALVRRANLRDAVFL